MAEEGDTYIRKSQVKKHTMALPAPLLFPTELSQGLLFLYEFIKNTCIFIDSYVEPCSTPGGT